MLSGSSTFLLDLEEEEGEDIVAPIIRETPPVSNLCCFKNMVVTFVSYKKEIMTFHLTLHIFRLG